MSRLGKEITAYIVAMSGATLIVGLMVTPVNTLRDVREFVQAWAVLVVIVMLFVALLIGLTWLLFTIYGKYQDWVSKNVI